MWKQRGLNKYLERGFYDFCFGILEIDHPALSTACLTYFLLPASSQLPVPLPSFPESQDQEKKKKCVTFP